MSEEQKKLYEEAWLKVRKMNWDHEYAENGIVNLNDAIEFAQNAQQEKITALESRNEELVKELEKERKYIKEMEIIINTKLQ